MPASEVTFGIRPEDLRIAGAADPADLSFDAAVEVVERLGSEILLDSRVGDGMMVASVEPTVTAKVHEKLRLAVSPSGCTSSTPRPKRRSDRAVILAPRSRSRLVAGRPGTRQPRSFG